MDRDYWQTLLTQEEHSRGYSDGFKLLYCPWRLLDTAETLFLSPNPGNDPSGEFMRIASDERGNSYLVKREARHSPIAEQYLKLCHFIGEDPEEVLTGTLMPFRTPDWKPLRDAPNIAVARPFWTQVLATGRIKRIFCIGRIVEDAVVDLTGARLRQQVPAKWGTLQIREYETPGGVQVYGLLHLSTYKMFSRPECLSALETLIGSPQPA